MVTAATKVDTQKEGGGSPRRQPAACSLTRCNCPSGKCIARHVDGYSPDHKEDLEEAGKASREAGKAAKNTGNGVYRATKKGVSKAAEKTLEGAGKVAEKTK